VVRSKGRAIRRPFLSGRASACSPPTITTALGELDLLAVHDGSFVVVEVRSSERNRSNEILATVDREKQRRITAAAVRFLSMRKMLDHAGAVRRAGRAMAAGAETGVPTPAKRLPGGG
jgi:hypothetical protein